MMEPKIQRVDLLAKFFHGFSDASRLAILQTLRNGELSVGEIVEATGLSQSNVSNHLSCLRNCGHVVANHQGRSTIYSINGKKVEKLLALADEILEANARGVYECSKI